MGLVVVDMKPHWRQKKFEWLNSAVMDNVSGRMRRFEWLRELQRHILAGHAAQNALEDPMMGPMMNARLFAGRRKRVQCAGWGLLTPQSSHHFYLCGNTVCIISFASVVFIKLAQADTSYTGLHTASLPVTLHPSYFLQLFGLPVRGVIILINF